jgi:phosphopantothenoylcysteine decarboxylase / phosphopantothenate---cysteine ligase
MTAQTKDKPLVTLGVTGCIGAYKSAEILRRLQDRGIDIQPVMTSAATEFITPLTLATLARRPAITSLWHDGGDWKVEHIAISDEQDALLVAPATADIIAKFAHGIADDFLSTLYLATTQPVIIAPAMNAKMWQHPATQENIAKLSERGVQFVQPGSGWLACGWEGEGRLAALEQIVDTTLYALHKDKSLAGKRVLVTLGPTAEDIDPMRFISNRSSGAMGIEVARAARARGAEVTVISAPVNRSLPFDVEAVSVRSAAEMYRAVDERIEDADILFMVAAVADYTPSNPSDTKIKKSEGDMTLNLRRTTDILAEIGPRAKRPFLVGFAAESGDLAAAARAKLKTKKADLIVGNLIGGAEGVEGRDETAGIIIAADGGEKTVQRCSKAEMAAIIMNEVEKRIS